MFIANKAALIKLKTEEKVMQRIEAACSTTVQKAASYKYQNLADEAKAKMKKNYAAKAKEFQ